MRILLLAAFVLIAARASAGDEKQFTTTKDCSSIVQAGNTYVLYTDRSHEAEAIPAKLVVHVDANTIEYRGNTFKTFESAKDEQIAKCG